MEENEARGFPVTLRLQGRSVLVVGGGPVALRKVEALSGTGAAVCVVAPEVCAELAARGGVEICRRPFSEADLEGRALVVVATGQPQVTEAVCAACARRGLWVNAADAPAAGDLTLPAVVRRGAVTVTVSTGGKSPAFARRLRSYLAQRLPQSLGPAAELAGALRRRALARTGAPEQCQAALRWLGSEEFFDLALAGRHAEAGTVFAERFLPDDG